MRAKTAEKTAAKKITAISAKSVITAEETIPTAVQNQETAADVINKKLKIKKFPPIVPHETIGGFC
jgi:hypothetical protein